MKIEVNTTFEENENKKVPLIAGWDYDYQVYQWAWKYGELVSASIETSNVCNLDCAYCFREENKTKSPNKPFLGESPKKELRLDELLELINSLDKLGVKTINIAGAGEPLMDKNLIPMLELMARKSITPLVATNGSLINKDWIDIFSKTNTSIMIKVNSFNNQKQDQMVNRKNYAIKRDSGLIKLMMAGFNKPSQNHQTRLSINSVVTKETINEIPQIFNFCRDYNIMPCMETYIPAGKTKEWTENEVSKNEFLMLADKLRLEDKKRGIEYMRLWPYLGGVPCTQEGKASIFINIYGDIYDCPAAIKNYGNLKETSVKKAFKKIKSEETNYCLGCPARDSIKRKS